MNAGKLQQVGGPLEVYDSPANLFVAQFIGTLPMNLLAGSLEDGGGTFVAGDLRLPVPAAWRQATAGKGGTPVTAGIRPEAIHEVGSGEVTGETTPLTLDVDFAEPLGHEVVVYGHHGEHSLVATLGPHRVPAMGTQLAMLLELDALHLFDTASERRLAV